MIFEAEVLIKLVRKRRRRYLEVSVRGVDELAGLNKLGTVRVRANPDGTVNYEGTALALKNLLQSLEKRKGNTVFKVECTLIKVLEAVSKAVSDGLAIFNVLVRRLRASLEEDLLAKKLRAKGLNPLRWVTIEGYNVDFLIDNKLVIEVEGLVHYREQVEEKDLKKLKSLEDKGYVVYRVSARDVRRDPEGVAELVKQAYMRMREKGA